MSNNIPPKQYKKIASQYENYNIEELRYEIQSLGEQLNNPEWYYIDPESGRRELYEEDYGEEVNLINNKISVIKSIIQNKLSQFQKTKLENELKEQIVVKKQKIANAGKNWHDAVDAYNLRKKQWFEHIEKQKKDRDDDLSKLLTEANKQKQIYNSLK